MSNPPIPEPIIVPILSAFSSVISNFESSNASFDAAIANCENLPNFFNSFFSIKFSATKSFTSAAIWTECSDVSNAVILSIPHSPFNNLSHVLFLPVPNGVTSPIPVGKQVTLAKGQSTELKMNITAAWTLKLTGLKYQVVDGTPYNYTVNDNYTNIATWGTLQVVYKS